MARIDSVRDVVRTASARPMSGLLARNYGAEYYHEHLAAGLDYLNFGDWQREYGHWLTEALDWRAKRVLDVGCACGSIMRGLGEAGAVVEGVDLNEYAINLGRERWPDMAGLMHVCDAANLHPFADGSWQAIHTAQVAEHWRAELVPHILRELARVTEPDGMLFCVLDTQELFERQGRSAATDDPTHLCIRPRAWWMRALTEAGWHDATERYAAALADHPSSFLPRYDWDWFVASKVSERPE